MEAYSTVKHDSRLAAYRFPSGAVPAGTEVRLRLYAPQAQGASLRLWDGSESFVRMERDGDFFTASVRRDEPCLLCYFFILHGARERYYLNAADMLGGEGELSDNCDTMRSYFITVYDRDYSTPQWCRSAVMYQIFPDRFARCGKTEACGHRMHPGWDEEPEYKPDAQKGYYAADDFFGGNFSGIEEKLEYLTDMGVNTLYLNPIFKAYSNHRYDTGDYEQVDELLGTNADFERLCRRAKEKGVRIILDGVFSHTGSDSRYFNREGHYDCVGAYNSPLSRYYPWYEFENYPDKYKCWWGVWSLPCTRETEPSFMDYILRSEDSVVKRWLRAGASGWRLDVADELPDEFLFELRSQVKAQDPDALIIGEVWEDASHKESYSHLRPYLQGRQLDSVMNYPLRNAVIDYIIGCDAGLFVRRAEALRENYPPQAFECLMNFVSTHDTVRACTALGEAPDGLTRDERASYRLSPERELLARARLEMAYAMLFMLPGIPCVYYGDEDYMQGYDDPFNRRTKRWGGTDNMCGLLKKLAYLHGMCGQTLTLTACGSALCIDRGGYIGIFNPSQEPLEQLLDRSLTDNGRVSVSSGGAELGQREQGLYLRMSPVSFCIIEVQQ